MRLKTFTILLTLTLSYLTIGRAAELNEAWLTSHISQIEQPMQRTELKSVYFDSDLPKKLPVQDGMKLIDVAYRAEPVGTLRWFALANVRCYGNFRFTLMPKNEAIKEFSLLFKKAPSASKVKAGDIMNESTRDFVDLTRSELIRQDMEAEDLEFVVVDAWRSFVTTSNVSQRPVRWMQWMDKVYFPGGITEYAHKHISDPALPQTFAVQAPLALAYATRPNDRKKVLPALLKAKALLPLKANGFPDENRVDRSDVDLICDEIIRQIREANLQTPQHKQTLLTISEEQLLWQGTKADQRMEASQLIGLYTESFGDPPSNPAGIKRIDAFKDKLKKSGSHQTILAFANQVFKAGFFEEYNYIQSKPLIQAALRVLQLLPLPTEQNTLWDKAEINLIKGAIYRSLEKDKEMKIVLNITWPTALTTAEQAKLKRM